MTQTLMMELNFASMRLVATKEMVNQYSHSLEDEEVTYLRSRIVDSLKDLRRDIQRIQSLMERTDEKTN